MNTGKLLTDNPELLHYIKGKLHLTVLGGISLQGLTVEGYIKDDP